MLAPRGAGARVRGGFRLAALLLVGLQLAGLAHLAFARHGLCWEHGVVVELEGAPAAAAPIETAAAPGLDGTAALGARSDAHLHCPALWLHRQIGPSRQLQLAIRAPTEAAEAFVPAVAPPSRWAALDRAPKQSPPL